VLGRSEREREEEETSRKGNGDYMLLPRAEDTDTFQSIGSSRRGSASIRFKDDGKNAREIGVVVGRCYLGFAGLDRNRSRSLELMEGRKEFGLK
jgi:hypothetical protein